MPPPQPPHQHPPDDGQPSAATRWIVIGVVAFFALVALVGIGAAVLANSGSGDVTSTEATSIAAGPRLPGDYDGNGVVTDEEYDRMPPAEFAELDDRTRVSDVGSKLHRYMPGALTELLRHTSPRETSLLSMPDVSKNRAQWSDQDYLNYYSIALLLVSGQGDQQSQIDEGRRALTVVMSPDHPNFSTVNSSIGKVNGIRSVYEALPSPYTNWEVPSGIYGQYSIGAEGGRLVLANYLPDGGAKEVKQYMLFINRSDNKGNVVAMLADSFNINDSKLRLFPK